MSNLNRLIGLAKRTGDRLVVHDSFTQESVVIMSVDEYEKLLPSSEREGGEDDDIQRQIDRDMALWRANRDLDDEWEDIRGVERMPWDVESEDEIPTRVGNDDDDDFDIPFGTHDSWDSVGDVIGSRYADIPFLDDDHSSPQDVDDNEEEDFGAIDWDGEDFGKKNPELEKEMAGFEIEDIPFDPPMPEKKEVPFVPQETVGDWEEESLPDDEPVFFEEPV
jgi:hypothetical protein